MNREEWVKAFAEEMGVRDFWGSLLNIAEEEEEHELELVEYIKRQYETERIQSPAPFGDKKYYTFKNELGQKIHFRSNY